MQRWKKRNLRQVFPTWIIPAAPESSEPGPSSVPAAAQHPWPGSSQSPGNRLGLLSNIETAMKRTGGLTQSWLRKTKGGHTLLGFRETRMKCFDAEKEENPTHSFLLLPWEPGFYGELMRKGVLSTSTFLPVSPAWQKTASSSSGGEHSQSSMCWQPLKVEIQKTQYFA